MTTQRIARVSAALAVIALIPAGLAACSGGQSVEEACGTIEGELTSAGEELQSALTDMMSGEGENPMPQMSEALAAAGDDVTNEEVKEVYGTFVTSFDELLPFFEEFENVDMEDPESLQKLQEMSADVQTKATDLEKAGADVQELCGFSAS
ncbi:hypothetical protein [Microbacterium sp. G2-8]|uniref:hypothetical protein n=1 Tax=Microbacterium sp. G2-8 TaxID=2842454 RepID=UPI001C8AE3AD|nr:hypothetical protein [Microbacterium sp. G2-8]